MKSWRTLSSKAECVSAGEVSFELATNPFIYIYNNVIPKVTLLLCLFTLKALLYLVMHPGWVASLSAPLSVAQFVRNWCPLQLMKAPSASLGQTDVFHTWHPHLHLGFVDSYLYVKEINNHAWVTVHRVKWVHFPKENHKLAKCSPLCLKCTLTRRLMQLGGRVQTPSLKSDINQINKDNSLPHTSCSESQPVSSLSGVCGSDPGAGRQLQSTVASSSSHPPL